VRRHGTATRKTMKTRRRRIAKAKPGGASISARRGHSSVAELQEQLDCRTHERDEALEQQRATAEVLKIVSASPTELQAVLEVVVRSAARFCEADDVTIFELDGQALRIAAHWGAVQQEIGVRFPCSRGSVAHQLMAIFGWDTLKEAEKYTAKADQRRLAESAMHVGDGKTYCEKDNGTCAN
jgi:hypothetical protein